MALPDWMIERDVGIEPRAEGVHRPGVISYGTTSYGYDARCGNVFKVFKPYPCSVIDPKAFDPRMLETVDLTGLRCQLASKGNGDMRRRSDWECSECKTLYRPNEDTGVPPEAPLCPAVKTADHILVPPHSFVLAETVETFSIPRDVVCVVVGKSTYARCGLIVNVTPLEPEWRGVVTVELSNTTPLPIKVYRGEGIMQCVFLRSDGCTRARMDEYFSHLLNKIDKMYFEDEDERIEAAVALGTCRTSYADKKGKYQDQAGLTLPVVHPAGAK